MPNLLIMLSYFTCAILLVRMSAVILFVSTSVDVRLSDGVSYEVVLDIDISLSVCGSKGFLYV